MYREARFSLGRRRGLKSGEKKSDRPKAMAECTLAGLLLHPETDRVDYGFGQLVATTPPGSCEVGSSRQQDQGAYATCTSLAASRHPHYGDHLPREHTV